MSNKTENSERKNGILDFILFAVPLVGVLVILLSKDQPPFVKLVALIATLVGLIGTIILYF